MQRFGRENYDMPGDAPDRDDASGEEAEYGGGEEASFSMSAMLERVQYPATKEDILDYAEAQGAHEEVLEMIDQLPDTTYNNAADVSQAIGENANMVA